MNRETQTTLVPADNGRAYTTVRNAESCQRPSIRNIRSGVATRVIVPSLTFILATLIGPAPLLAGPFSASGLVWQEWYAPGPPGVSTVGPTGASFSQYFSFGSVGLSSTAEARAGHLSLHAYASIVNMEAWDSGNFASTARGSVTELMIPGWEVFPNSAETFIFTYSFMANGNVTSSSAGPAAAGGYASLEYGYRVGDSSGGGYWSADSEGHTSRSGTWGWVFNSFTARRGESFVLGLSAAATGAGRKTYNPYSDATVIADADFSHTLIWLGITGVRAFDSLGNEVPLPPDFYLPLIGQDSGFNYWYSADGPEPVPEPATALLLGSGLLVAGLIRKSAVRRRDS